MNETVTPKATRRPRQLTSDAILKQIEGLPITDRLNIAKVIETDAQNELIGMKEQAAQLEKLLG